MASSKNYFEDQLSFYGAYHSVFGNQLVHFVFVPLLLISGTSLSFTIFSSYFGALHLVGWSLMYPLTYIYIDAYCGLSWLPMAVLTWFSAKYVFLSYSFMTVLIFFVVSFGIQVVSHYVIEKRKPAFLDSLYQSLVLAPLFVWCELVVFPLGFYQKTQENVERKIEEIQKNIQ